MRKEIVFSNEILFKAAIIIMIIIFFQDEIDTDFLHLRVSRASGIQIKIHRCILY